MPGKSTVFTNLKRGKVLVAREVKGRLRDPASLIYNGLVALVLGLIVGIVLRSSKGESYRLETNFIVHEYPFFAVLVALFFGMALAINEVSNDFELISREAVLKVPALVYVAAKALVLGVFVVLPVALFTGVSLAILGVLTSSWKVYPASVSFLSIVAFTGVTLGLLGSSLPFVHERTAVIALPLLLIPQILFAGSEMLPFSQMPHLHAKADTKEHSSRERRKRNLPAPIPAQVMPSRWAYHGYWSLLQFSYLWSEDNKSYKKFAPKTGAFPEPLGVSIAQRITHSFPNSQMWDKEKGRPMPFFRALRGAVILGGMSLGFLSAAALTIQLRVRVQTC